MYFSLVLGVGDVAYNSRRGIFGAISLLGKASYHLFDIGYSELKQSDYSVKLLKKTKWHQQRSTASPVDCNL